LSVSLNDFDPKPAVKITGCNENASQNGVIRTNLYSIRC